MKQVHGWCFPDADQFMASEIDENGHYQADHLEAALKYIRVFGVAVDGGAHVGTWSRLLAKKFNRVLAFEPAADTFEALRSNMQIFGCSNVELYKQALSDRFKQVDMAINERESARGNTGARFTQAGTAIQAIPLDHMLLPRLDFLKLDIEGGELSALFGAQTTIKRCKPVLLFEDKPRCREQFGVDARAIPNLLSSWRYMRCERVGDDEIWMPRNE